MCEIFIFKKLKTPQSLLRRFKVVCGEVEKRTFRFTKHIASFYFFGTFRFADYSTSVIFFSKLAIKRG